MLTQIITKPATRVKKSVKTFRKGFLTQLMLAQYRHGEISKAFRTYHKIKSL